MATIDDTFRALADPTRRMLLDRLHAANGQTLSALAQGMGMSRQAVTQHLQVLEAANLVTVRWHGREKLHFFNPVPIHEISTRWIQKYEQHRLDVLHDLKTTLEGTSDEHHLDDHPRLRHVHQRDP